MDALKRLQDLFRELFQLDLADLDFGLYRLFHLKRVEIEAFLQEQLPRRVREAFQNVAGEEARDIQTEVSALSERIRREVDDGAICSDGEVHSDYRKTKVKSARKLIDDYEEKRQKLKAVEVTEAQQAEVFNHLHACLRPLL